MDKLVIKEVLMSLTLCSIFLILVFLLVRLYFSISYEKRIKGFALDTKTNDELSISDSFINFIKKIIKSLSKILNKSILLNDYAKRFDKYMIYQNSVFLESIDLISIKFLVMFLIQILYGLSTIIKIGEFDIYQFIIVSLISFFAIDIMVIIVYKNEKKQIEEQLLQAIVIMNSAFKSGKNILQAIEIVKKELPSPIKEEFAIIHKDLSYGLSLSDAFNRFYDRVKVLEAKYITSSLALLSKTGGNIVTVFNMIEKNFYDRLRIRNELDALTSSSKLLFRALIIMPIIFILVIVLLNPSYFDALLTTKIGIIIDIIMVTIYFLYIIVINKVMKVDEV